jgi:hypothetical protein
MLSSLEIWNANYHVVLIKLFTAEFSDGNRSQRSVSLDRRNGYWITAAVQPAYVAIYSII